jgi:zinc/manganese transport system ATP-binding protein
MATLYCNHDRPVVPDRRRGRPNVPRRGGARIGVGRGDLGAVITLDNVELRHGERVILSGVSGTIEAGSLTALIGPNGSGKTTLLRAIAGLHKLTSGRIDRHGLQQADIALLAQSSHLDRSFPITCRDVVALAANRLGPFRSIGRDRLAATRAALDRVGLAEMGSRPIQALSAGQFQRILFARTIVQDARLILLDEPFTAVDATTTRLLMPVIHEWHTQGRTVMAVLHDMEIVRQHFPHTLRLTGQGAVWDSVPDPGIQAA